MERWVQNLRYDMPRLLLLLAAVLIVILLIVLTIVGISSHRKKSAGEAQATESTFDIESTQETYASEETETTEIETESEFVAPTVGIGYTYPDEDGWYTLGETKVLEGFTAERTENTKWPSESDVDSQYAVLIDESTNEIVVGKNEDTIINPASMTKILTVLVAAEHITDLDDTFTITFELSSM